jgi:hypothetical protein
VVGLWLLVFDGDESAGGERLQFKKIIQRLKINKKLQQTNKIKFSYKYINGVFIYMMLLCHSCIGMA